MALISIDLIKSKLNEHIDKLVSQLFPNAEKDGNEWRLGDIHGRPGRSLAIHRGTRRAGIWKDFSSEAGGDVLDLVAAGRCHGDVKAAIAWARDWLNLGQLNPEDARKAEQKAAETRRSREEEESRSLQRLRKAALARFLEAVPLSGTPGDRYLMSRAIFLRELGKMPGAIRFHPGLKCPEYGIMRPALVGKIDGPDGELLSIHRTFLHVQRDGRVTKASADPDQPMKDCKRAYCSYEGGWIPVWRGASGKPIKHAPKGEWIAVSEGKEDALSIAMEMPQMRSIAAISLSNLGKLKLPTTIGGIYIHRQNDTHPDTIASFERAADQLIRRGYSVREARAPEPHKDFTAWREVRMLEAMQQRGVA
jgi:hypothetical protein